MRHQHPQYFCISVDVTPIILCSNGFLFLPLEFLECTGNIWLGSVARNSYRKLHRCPRIFIIPNQCARFEFYFGSNNSFDLCICCSDFLYGFIQCTRFIQWWIQTRFVFIQIYYCLQTLLVELIISYIPSSENKRVKRLFAKIQRSVVQVFRSTLRISIFYM